MVLAAGLGLRMRPLTLLRAKPALPVLNRPLIHWTLELLRRHGVTDVVVNLHHLPATVRRAVGDGRALGLRVSYSFERELLGTGGGPRKVRRLFGDEPFLLVNGDVVFDMDLSDLVRRHVASGARATLALKAHRSAAEYGGIVTGPGGFIRSLAGLPRFTNLLRRPRGALKPNLRGLPMRSTRTCHRIAVNRHLDVHGRPVFDGCGKRERLGPRVVCAGHATPADRRLDRTGDRGAVELQN